MNQDTIDMVTKVVMTVDSCGDPVATAIHTHPILKELSDGIEWTRFFWGFVGSVILILTLWAHKASPTEQAKKPFYFVSWIVEKGPFMLLCFICGPISIFAVNYYQHPPATLFCIGAGTVGGFAAYYIIPMLISESLWTSIGDKIIGIFKSKT